MKNILKALTVLAAAAVLASCDQKEDYVTYSYVLLNTTSLSVSEADGTVTLGLTAYPQGDANINTEITFEVIDGTAKNGTDFTVSPASGVLSVTSTTASISLNIVDFSGEYTGDKSFSIKLTDASNGWTIGGVYQTTVTISDLDHPLSTIAGSYTASGTSYWDGAETWDVAFYTDSEDTSIIWIDGINPYIAGYYANYGTAYCVYGTVSSDLSTITVETPFLLGGYYSGYYALILLFDGTYYYTGGDLTLTWDESTQTWTSDYGVGLCASSTADLEGYAGFFDLMNPPITFTKN